MSEITANPKSMKKIILRGIRTELLKHGGATKVELSRKLDISFPTISKFINQMEKSGEVVSLGLDHSGGGRRAVRYDYNADYKLGLAVFLERTETGYIVFNCRGEVKERRDVAGVLMEDVTSLTAQIESLITKYPKISSLTIGVPAAVSNGRIIHIPDYEQFQDLDLKGYCEQRFSVPVVVENDMNAAVLGYYMHSRHKDASSLVYLYFGQNGPGAGIMVNGRLVRGSTFFSGEISFVPQYDNRNFRQAMQLAREEALRGKADFDPVSRLIASITSILNPHRIVFCNDEVNSAMLAQIATGSTAYIPAEHLPEMAVSNWKEDYLNGLQGLGLELMLAGADQNDE
ncbi:ROK family transcriptional regulator [Paenibacillus sp. P96]|uniref:ROK family transcriptional regulator n=1 Tax=Paenibacillus zeirhizosphaerae TaxID=2987519 RepID=A0ABT9FSB3_9BACL|nr:ROK family transcriptional regulator [Paenibacillus sp. P96]MDP4097622.1 ROK family transcriptional regulator [Paenibacillus sp. P96]